MNLDARIINFKKAVRQGRSKKIIEYKFIEYKKEYDLEVRTIRDKLNYHDIFLEYCNYMKRVK
jgi:hypothetical protein